MANADVRLSLFSLINFAGRRIQLNRGGAAVRDARAFRFDKQLSSFQLQNAVNSSQVTLVLFSKINFQGTFRVFRGTQNVANLLNFNRVTSSFILVGRRLTNAQINQIRSTGNPPNDVLVVSQ